MRKENNLYAYLLLIAVIVCWGFNWPVLKVAIHVIPPFWLTPLRLLLSAAVLFFILGCQKRLCWPARKEWRLIFIVAVFQMGLFTMCVTLGLRYVDAGRASILAYTTPLWVLPMALVFLGERLTLLKFLGFLLGIIGVVLLFNPLTFDWHDKTAVLGSGYLMLAAFLWAIAIVNIRAAHWIHTPFQLAPWQMLIAVFVLTPIACLAAPHPHIEWGLNAVWTLSYIVFISTAFAYWAAVEVNKHLAATTTALGFQAVPVVGLLSSAIFLHEHITFIKSSALIIIIFGLVLVVYSETKRKKNVIPT